MYIQALSAVLPFLLLTSAAPTKRTCSARSKSPSSSLDAVAAIAVNQDVQPSSNESILVPTDTVAVIPQIEETSLADPNQGVIAAWDKGGWKGWGRPKSSTAVAQPPANTAAAAPPPPSSPPPPPTGQPPVQPPTSVVPNTPIAPPPTVVPNTPPTSAAPVVPPPPVSVPPVGTAVPPPVSAPPVGTVVPSVPASPPVQSAPPVGGAAPGGDGQGGLGLDDTAWQKLTNVPNLGWYWNWKTTPFQIQSEFVACVWGEQMANEFTGTVPAGTKYIMSFNEPDMGADVGGSNILDVAKAATLHQQWTAKLTPGVKIGSPAVARGGDVKWFTPWVTACAGNCKYDFIPIHFYGTVVEDMISYIKAFPAGGKPMWVTEFDCQDFTTGEICDPAKQQLFMDTAIAWFQGEGSAYVERWAWFGALLKFSDKTYGLLKADGTLNELGNHYLSL